MRHLSPTGTYFELLLASGALPVGYAAVLVIIEYARDDRRRQITVRLSGPCAFSDLMALVDRHRAEGVWSYAMLYDITDMEGLPTRLVLQALVDYVHRHVHTRPRGPVAVAASDPATINMVRLYASFNASMNICAFPTVVAAEQWLDTQHSQPGAGTDAK